VTDRSRPITPEFAAGWENATEVTTDDDEGTSLEHTLDGVCNALDQLDKDSDWLLWVDLATLLTPWDVPEQFQTRYFGQEGEADDEEEDEEDSPEPQEEPVTPLIDPQLGCLAPEDDTTFLRLQRSYAAAVSYFDSGLELLFEELRTRELLDDL